MPDPVWPASLPQLPQVSGYSEESKENAIRSEPDQGPPKMRRRFTLTYYEIGATVMLDATQIDALQTFYDSTLLAGTLRFTWVNFRSGATASYTFRGKPKFAPLGGLIWEASLELLRLT